MGVGQSFISQAGSARLGHRLGQRATGREMKIGEESLTWSNDFKLFVLRLFDFHNQFGRIVDVLQAGNQFCPRMQIGMIGNA